MYHGTLTWTKLILKFCYFPVNVPDTLSRKLRYIQKDLNAYRSFFDSEMLKKEQQLKKQNLLLLVLPLLQQYLGQAMP